MSGALEPTQAAVGLRLSELTGGVLPCEPAGPEESGGRERVSHRTPAPAVAYRAPTIANRAPSVAYLLPGLPAEGSGGSHSLVQEARGLRALGADASVCVPEDALATATAVYGNEDSLFVTYAGDPMRPEGGDGGLLEAVAGADVVVATEYPSVDLLGRLARERPEVVCAYYVQDYEPLFAAPESSRADRALLSYRAVDGLLLFAKTRWLCDLVGAVHGVAVVKVQPSLDTDLFHARGRKESERTLRVAAMIRPRTPRRRPAATLQALAEIAQALGEGVEIATFGCAPESYAGLRAPAMPGVGHLGLLSRAEVARLMRHCDVFVDASAYQAFGRTGLEAMACGAVPLLPALGGVHEYAVEDGNAVILDDGSPQAIAAAVIALARDRRRLGRLRQAGVLAAQRFSVERAARSQLELFANAAARADARAGAVARADAAADDIPAVEATRRRPTHRIQPRSTRETP
ncbi:MAG TPA: glycosyltransferase [Solirubrobacteraceae bacterium]